MAKAFSPAKIKAFSLFELVIVIAIVAILSITGVGVWHHYRNVVLTHMLTNRVRQALAFTRSQAILRNQVVIYCGSSDQVNCDGHWSIGQIVRTIDAKELQHYPRIPEGISLAFIGNLGRKREIRFNPDGFTNGQQGHFSICGEQSDQCDTLVVHYSGEIVVQR